MFKSLFRPKWQSTKPQTRIQALQGLDITNKNHRQTIELMARRDLDKDVRLAAIKRLNKRNTVVELIQVEQDMAVCQGAIDHLLSLVSVRAAGTEDKCIETLKAVGPQVLSQFVKNTTDMELGSLAIKSIDDEGLLEQFAVELSMTQPRQLAAHRLHSEAALERVVKASKGKDKSVWRICKEKLQGLREKQQEEATIEQQINHICQSLEALSRLPFDNLYAAKLDHLQKQWQRLQLHADQEANQRFSRAFSLCRVTVDEANDAQSRLVEEDRQKRSAMQERMAACELLEDAVRQFGDHVELKQEDLPALQGLLSTQRVRWDEAAAIIEPEADERKRFSRISEQLQSVLEVTRQLIERETDIQAQASLLLDMKEGSTAQIQKQCRKLEKALGGLRWPERFVEPKVLVLYRQAVAHGESLSKEAKRLEQQAVDNVKARFSDLKREIDAGHLKPANKRLKEVSALVKHLPMNSASSYQKQLRELTIKLNELRDWQGFVSTPKKEELCLEMESLVAMELDPQERSNKIRRIQAAWRELGEADKGRNKELWERFSQAADKAYEPCRDYFDRLSEVRSTNLAQRQQICEQVSEYLARYDWDNADWKAVNEVYETAKKEWRVYSPVDRKEGKKTQERFNGLLNQLQGRLHAEFERNKARREDMIRQAEALIELEDLSSAIEQIKQLQQAWRQVGMVSKKDDHRLWRQFRSVCDRIFKRRDEQKEAYQKNLAQNSVHAEHLCEQIEQLAESDLSQIDEAQQEFRQLKQRFLDLGDLPKEQQAGLKARFQTVCDLFVQGILRAQGALQGRMMEEMWRRAKLCEQLEEAACSGEPVDAVEEMIDGFQQNWSSGVSLPEGTEKPMQQRKEYAIQLLRGQIRMDESVLNQNCESLHELCIRLEIAVGVYSPKEDQSRRMALQVSRLSDGLSQRGETLEGNALIEQLQKEWCSVGMVDPNQRTVLHGRFQSVIRHLSD